LEDEDVGVARPSEADPRVEIVLGLIGVLMTGVEIGSVVDRPDVILLGVVAALMGLAIGFTSSVISTQARRIVIAFMASYVVSLVLRGVHARVGHVQ
jgi:hypothetical protein